MQYFLTAESIEESLCRIGDEADLLPSIAAAESSIEFSQKEAPLFAMLAKSIIADDMNVAAALSEDDKRQFQINHFLDMQIAFNSYLILDELFRRLVEEKGLNAETLWHYLDEWGQIDEDNLEIIRGGLERYFERDYVSILHILIPQFEDVLRTLFERAGLSVIKQRTQSLP